MDDRARPTSGCYPDGFARLADTQIASRPGRQWPLADPALSLKPSLTALQVPVPLSDATIPTFRDPQSRTTPRRTASCCDGDGSHSGWSGPNSRLSPSPRSYVDSVPSSHHSRNYHCWLHALPTGRSHPPVSHLVSRFSLAFLSDAARSLVGELGRDAPSASKSLPPHHVGDGATSHRSYIRPSRSSCYPSHLMTAGNLYISMSILVRETCARPEAHWVTPAFGA
ncbi:hypothetical protein C8Q76DRAFT_160154 [Earliella scabrosa]|nr:hypothetical protein C8Q76DRAFT_160154 [Earliella scabrosa]